MKEWYTYCNSYKGVPPGPLRSASAPDSGPPTPGDFSSVPPSVWRLFQRKYDVGEHGALVAHDNFLGGEFVVWPAEACHAVDALTREDLHKLITLEQGMPEDLREVLLPTPLVTLLQNCRAWLTSVAEGEASASTVESLRLDHAHRCPGLTLELVDALHADGGMRQQLERLWGTFTDAEKQMKMFQNVAQRCAQVITDDESEMTADSSGPSPALVDLATAYRARFAGSARDAETNEEWMALQELNDPVTRLGRLLNTRLFLSFCQRSVMMQARLASGLQWTRVPAMLETWDEAVQEYMDEHIDATQMEKMLEDFGIEGAWDEKSAPMISRELQEVFGEALADALQFYLLAKRTMKYVGAILEFMERLHDNFPTVPCSGDLIDLLRSFVENSGHGFDTESQANLSHIGRNMLSAWGTRRHDFCKTLTARLPDVKAAHEALESKNFDDLRRIINSLPGFVEEQQVFESLFDVRATLQPFFEPETYFPDVAAVLNWLSTPTEEEMTRFENAVSQLEHYLDVFNNVVREWTTDEYERCIEQIEKALSNLQVELRPDMASVMDVTLDAVDDWLVFNCLDWTSDWTPFSEMKMVEYRMFLYGEPKEEDRSKVETFHQLISQAEQLARLHVRMLHGGFADACGVLQLVDLDSSRWEEDEAEANVQQVVVELTEVVRDLQNTIEEQEAALVQHGGTFLPTATTAQLLAALKRGAPEGEDEEISAFLPAFSLDDIEVPDDSGSRAEQMIILDGMLRKRVRPEEPRAIKAKTPLKPLHAIRPGRVHLIVTEPRRLPLLQLAIAVFAELRQRLPRWYELLIYTEKGDYVNLDEARAFASRMAHPCQDDDLFVVCGWSYAPRSHWTMFREWLDEHEAARQATVFLTAGPAKAVKNPHADCTVMSELCDATAIVTLKQAWAPLWPQVQSHLPFTLVVDSQVPGKTSEFHAGKSYRIAKRDPAAQRVSLFHFYRPHILLQALRGIYSVDDESAVWVNISGNCPDDAEAMLLQLLVCGLVLDPRGTPVALDRNRRFVIELPRRKGLPFCREVLPKEQIGPPAHELDSSLQEVQVVSRYLRELAKPDAESQLVCRSAGQPDFKADTATPAVHEEVVDLLRQYGPKFRGEPAVDCSMTTLMQYVRYLSGQLRRLESSTVYFLNMFMADMSRNSRRLKFVTVGRLVSIAATMFDAALDADTFELSRGWDEATQDPLLFLSRFGECTLSVFLAPGEKDKHFNWAEFGFEQIDRADSRRARQMLDRCLSLPKKTVRLEATVSVFIKSQDHRTKLREAVSADLVVQADTKLCGESLRRGYQVTSHTAVDFDTAELPLSVTFSTTQLAELKAGLADDMIATTEMNLGGVHIAPGMALSSDAVGADDGKIVLSSKADLDNLLLPATLTFVEASALEADQGYVLTMDNVLKMVLISQRLENGPVLLMGETGCGKTSLITYLCKVAGIDLHALDVHGGIDMNDVRTFMGPVIEQAVRYRERHVWVFLDELNTSPCIDVFAEMLCESRFDGRALPDNIRVLGACNPYRKSSAMTQPGNLMTSISGGLSAPPLDRSLSTGSQAEEIFVYQVLPLPTALVDFIWDFGSLKEKERAQYVREMVEQHVPACGRALADQGLEGASEEEPKEEGHVGVALPDLVAHAMKLVLRNEDPSCVSLRDARRSVVLAGWFYKSGVGARHAAVLSTAVGFYFRLMTAADREEFWQFVPQALYAPYDSGRELLRAYQDGFTEVVHVPEGVARNEALTSNIFVMLTAVANRIPVFVVGKPGQSKTLAVSLLGSGRTSTEVKTTIGVVHAPLLSVLSYQCSEHTTADSLDHHFVQGEQLQQRRGGGGGAMRGTGTKACRVQIVIFLDEVGLAEKNKSDRPLKVLHKHLENPSVGMIGLSNTPLDASKMNRAIYLSHLDPGPTDLKSTANVMLQKCGLRQHLVDDFSESISQLFVRVLDNLKVHKDGAFEHLADHRGFYNLIKGLVRLLAEDSLAGAMVKGQRDVCDLVLRNLGGVPVEDIESLVLRPMCECGFAEAVQNWRETSYPENAQRMMAQNLEDHVSRHLMVIAPSEVRALHFLFSRGLLKSEEAEVFFGSSFPEDAQSKLYIFRLLSKIRMCMEIGRKVVLLNLGRLHESLYEVLNQQYIYFNGKPTCRIALGAESRQVPVHKDFRCIVVLTKKEVHQSHADVHGSLEMRFLSALLSRFEKVVLDDESELPSHLFPALDAVRQWMGGFGSFDVFPGAGEDAPSLMLRKLLWTAGDAVTSPEDAERGIQKRLLDMMPAYHILKNAGKLGAMLNEYVEDECHASLEALLAAASSNHKIADCSLVVRTYDEQDVEGINSDMPLVILPLRDFSTEYTFTRALARELPNIESGGTLVVDCMEAEVSPAMLQHVQRLVSGALYDLPPCEDMRRMLFLLRQQPYTPVPVATTDFGDEWQHYWVETLRSGGSRSAGEDGGALMLKLGDLIQPPAALGDQLVDVVGQMLPFFNVCSYVEYPAAIAIERPPQEVADRLIGDPAFTQVAAKQLVPALMEDPKMQSWLGLLSKENPFGVHEPVVEAALHALEVRVHEVFAELWTQLDMDANVDSYSEGFTQDLWLGLATNATLVPLNLTHRSVMKKCNISKIPRLGKFPFISHIMQQFRRLDAQLWVHLGGETGTESPDARWTRAYRWLNYQLLQILQEPAEPIGLPEDWAGYQEQLLKSCVSAAAPGIEIVIQPVALHFLTRELKAPKTGFELLRRVAVSSWVARSAFLRDEALEAAIRSMLSQEGRMHRLRPFREHVENAAGGRDEAPVEPVAGVVEKVSVEETLQRLLLRAGEILRHRAREGEIVSYAEFAHAEKILHVACPVAEDKALADVAKTGLAMANLLVLLNAYADLALRFSVPEEQVEGARWVLQSWAIFLLGAEGDAPSDAEVVDTKIISDIPRVNEILSLAQEACPAAFIPLVMWVAQRLYAAATTTADTYVGSISWPTFPPGLLQLLSRPEFPELVTIEMLRHVIFEEEGAQETEKLLIELMAGAGGSVVDVLVELGKQPLARAIVIRFEQALGTIGAGGLDTWAIDLKEHPILSSLRSVAEVRLSWRRMRDQVRNVLAKKVSDDPKAEVQSFAKLAERLDPAVIKAWGLESLNNEFGQETLQSPALVIQPATNIEGEEAGEAIDAAAQHLLVPDFYAAEAMRPDSEMDKCTALPGIGFEYSRMLLCVKQGQDVVEASAGLKSHSTAGLVLNMVGFSATRQGITVEGSRDLAKKLIDDGVVDTAEGQLFAALLAGEHPYCTLLREVEVDIARLIAASVAGALSASRAPETTFLRDFLVHPEKFKNRFMWCMARIKYYDQLHDIKLSEYKARLEDANYIPIYECPNGHPYWLGNCSRPWVEYTCNMCTERIGGTGHKLLPGNRNVPKQEWYAPQKGYCYSRWASSSQHLPPRAFLAFQFWTHAVLLGSLLLNLFNESSQNAKAFLPPHFPYSKDSLASDLLNSLRSLLENLCSPTIAPQNFDSRSDAVDYLLLLFMDVRSWSRLFGSPVDLDSEPGLTRLEQRFVHDVADAPRKLSDVIQLQTSFKTCPKGLLSRASYILNLPSLMRLRSLALLDALPQLEAKRPRCKTFWLLHGSWRQLLYCAELPKLLRLPRILFESFSGRLSKIEAMRLPLREALGDRCGNLWNDFASAWNNVRGLLTRVECAEVHLEELDPEKPAESLAAFVDFDRDLGLQLWNLVTTISSYQNNFLDAIGHTTAASVPVLRFERRFAVPLAAFAGGEAAGAGDTWAVDVVPCAFRIDQAGRWNFSAEAFELMSRTMIAPLQRIALEPKPTFEFVALPGDDWQRMLNEVLPQEVLSTEVALAVSKAVAPGGSLPPELAQTLLMLVTKMVHQILGGVRANPKLKLFEFAQNHAGAAMKRKAAGYQTLCKRVPELVDVRLCHLISLWEYVFDHFEPDYAAIVHVIFQAELEDAEQYGLWQRLQIWPRNEVRAVRLWFKLLLGDRLIEDSFPPTAPVSHMVYAVAESHPVPTSGNASDRLLDAGDEGFSPLPLGQALATYRLVVAVLDGDEPEAVKREAVRVEEERQRLEREAEAAKIAEAEKAKLEEEEAKRLAAMTPSPKGGAAADLEAGGDVEEEPPAPEAKGSCCTML